MQHKQTADQHNRWNPEVYVREDLRPQAAARNGSIRFGHVYLPALLRGTFLS